MFTQRIEQCILARIPEVSFFWRITGKTHGAISWEIFGEIAKKKNTGEMPKEIL